MSGWKSMFVDMSLDDDDEDDDDVSDPTSSDDSSDDDDDSDDEFELFVGISLTIGTNTGIDTSSLTTSGAEEGFTGI